MQVHIKNPQLFNEKKQAIKSAGKDACYVISDFDRTLTYGTFNGKKTPSIISLLRDGNHLTHLQLRGGVVDCLKKLEENWIPLVIFSASGCGDAIPLFMQHNACDFSNISYVINRFSRDENGFAKGIEWEIIHALNKSEGVFSKFPQLRAQLEERSNVILIGDGLGDAEMAQGWTHETVLKIWILTLEDPEVLKAYEDAFDLVLLGDGDFDKIGTLLEEILV